MQLTPEATLVNVAGAKGSVQHSGEKEVRGGGEATEMERLWKSVFS